MRVLDFPEYNGNYIVENIFQTEEYLGYYLGFSTTCEITERSWWDQSALRKKHPPARDDNGEIISYTQMISNLKGVTV